MSSTKHSRGRLCPIAEIEMQSARRDILLLTHRVPFPPDKGDKIRTFHQIDHLAQSHNVYCACFVDDEKDLQHVRTLRRWCRDVVAVPWKGRTALVRAAKAWMWGRTMTCAAYESPAMRLALMRWCEKTSFDVVTAFSSSMAPYALRVPAGRRILDLCDADSQKWLDYAERSRGLLSPVYAAEGRRLRRFESGCLDRFDATLVITQRERRLLDPECAHPRVRVVANGVDLPVEPPRPASLSSPTVCFIGAMNYRPNVEGAIWFVRDVWPEVRRRVPLARFIIVGHSPSRRVRRLSSVGGVEVAGSVTDVGPFLQAARVVVAPLHIARGLQNKVLEAMAMARPVVATSAVSSCLTAEPGHELIVADRAGDFGDKVVQALKDDALCDRIGAAGRNRAAASYHWPRILQRYEQILLGGVDDLAREALPFEEAIHPPRRLGMDSLTSGAVGTFRGGEYGLKGP